MNSTWGWGVGLGVVASLVVGWVGVLDETSVGTAGDGRTGVRGVVGWTDGGSNWDTSTDGAELSVLDRLLLATEPAALAGAFSVVVAWGWTEALLLLVVADEKDLHKSGQEEEDCANDRDGECGSVESASLAQCVGWTVSNWGLDGAAAAARARVSQDGHGDEGTNHEDIDNNGEETEEGDTAEAASQKDCEGSVDDSDTGHTLNSLLPFWNW